MDILKQNNIELSLAEVWSKGGDGAIDLAEKVIKLANTENKFRYVYELEHSLKTKIEKIAKKIYGAEGVEYSEEAEKDLEHFEKLGYKEFPICIAKTQYSFSDDAKNLLCDKPYKIHINEVILKAGAEFIVAKTGKIFTMPGLPRIPSAENIDLDENGNIIGIF